MSNEKGFIFPLTLSACTLILFVFVHYIGLYSVEQRFIKEREQFEVLQNLIQLGVVDVIEIVLNSDRLDSYQGTRFYPHGKVTFSVVPVNDVSVKISISSYTLNNGKYNVLLLYDKTKRNITRWVEG